MDLRLYDLREDDFDSIIELGNKIHGYNYLDHKKLEQIYKKSCLKGRCCSKVIYDRPRGKGALVGFRLTYAPGNWEIDKWCSPEEWKVDLDKVCYFKSNTVDETYRGLGIGSYLLEASTQTAQGMGALAGVTHIWLQSPGNSAFRYFTKNGGQLIYVWPSRWQEDSLYNGYLCVICGNNCHCDAAEMILYFGETRHE